MAVMAIPGNRPFVVAPEKADDFLSAIGHSNNREKVFAKLKEHDKGTTVWETKKG